MRITMNCSHFLNAHCFLSLSKLASQSPPLHCANSHLHPAFALKSLPFGFLSLPQVFQGSHPFQDSIASLRIWKSRHIWSMFPGSTFPTEGPLLSPAFTLASCLQLIFIPSAIVSIRRTNGERLRIEKKKGKRGEIDFP